MYIPAKINANLNRILQKSLLFSFLYFSTFSFAYSQNSSDSLLQQRNKIQDSLIRSGFWEAKVVIDQNNDLQIEKGRPYFWKPIQVYNGQIPIAVQNVEKLSGKIANQYVLNKKLRNYVRMNYHRKGFPLAKANLSISSLDENQVEAIVRINPQNFIVYDSLEIDGDSRAVNVPYLSNLLSLRYNEPFDIKAYNAIGNQIDQIQYLRLASSPTLSFANNKAKIQVNLQKVKSNQFDAIIGLIPEGNRTNLTGQVDARLRNLFKRGVGLDVFWQKYSANSQILNTSFRQSHAFKSPLGLNFGFELLQEDSTFLQTDLQLGVQYFIWSNFSIGMAYQRLSNNILRGFSEEEISNLNPLRSSNTNAVLINFYWRNELTYPQLSNYSFATLNFGFGNKKITNFSALPTAWQNVPEVSNSFSTGIKLHFQRVLGKRILLEAVPQYAIIKNPALSQNDLLRLGGLQNLRGFDRNFFYSRYYGLLNLNYRYFLDQRSSFFLLTDLAKLPKNIDWVYAFGAGVDVKSQNGWFRIIYALGNQLGNKPEFSQGKVHFGYIAVF
ncbi:hypothetical protein [Marivirga harenae]|uniref:hypothetical protein n=1 Tax=Marivirga harenae TaxID=2010992 RepID=UPI0026E08BD1|nr:hypothetical protein [Marivirga harenae]WKV13472.1 hypothetical protein Q3Y49_06485 [Marivirga harenae]